MEYFVEYWYWVGFSSSSAGALKTIFGGEVVRDLAVKVGLGIKTLVGFVGTLHFKLSFRVSLYSHKGGTI